MFALSSPKALLKAGSLFFSLAAVVSASSCGATPSNSCLVTANITPAAASADHVVASPGNQVQFALNTSVAGNCPLIADKLGAWSSSDPLNVSISSTGVATCLGATPSAVTIANSGTVRGHTYQSASLSCQ